MDSSVTDIVFIRHGETVWNAAGRIQGHEDSDLTAEGLAQARAVAGELAGETFDAVYTSDLGRAMRTAQIIGDQLGLVPIADARLREKSYGLAEGLTRQEFQANYPEGWAAFLGADPDYALPEGECQRQVHSRTIDCANDLAQRHAGQRIVVVTHGGVLTCLFRYVIGLDVSSRRHFSLPNASINRFLCETGKWTLVSWGEVRHLRELSASDDL